MGRCTLELRLIWFSVYGSIKMILWKDSRSAMECTDWSGMRSARVWTLHFA
jgi:hypothetical protein